MVIRDAARLRDFVLTAEPPLSDYTARVIGGNWGKLMYCGAVEFVCSPSAVSHIPVLLDECMGHLNPYAGGFLPILLSVAAGIAGKYWKPMRAPGFWRWIVIQMPKLGLKAQRVLRR